MHFKCIIWIKEKHTRHDIRHIQQDTLIIVPLDQSHSKNANRL